MLFDPQWDVDQRFTLAALTAWLETKQADAVYDPSTARECLIGQYLQDIGWEAATIGGKSIDLGFTQPMQTIAGLALGGPSSSPAFTFGAALKRARALQP